MKCKFFGMKNKPRLTAGAAVMTALLAVSVLSGCKGRTMENMTPDGDTVEVTPDTITDTIIDTVSAPDSVVSL